MQPDKSDVWWPLRGRVLEGARGGGGGGRGPCPRPPHQHAWVPVHYKSVEPCSAGNGCSDAQCPLPWLRKPMYATGCAWIRWPSRGFGGAGPARWTTLEGDRPGTLAWIGWAHSTRGNSAHDLCLALPNAWSSGTVQAPPLTGSLHGSESLFFCCCCFFVVVFCLLLWLLFLLCCCVCVCFLFLLPL